MKNGRFKAGLQLGRILLKNYKAYAGEVYVNLSLDPHKTVTVIHGEMGKGKTTLIGAIYWCLYGREKPGRYMITDETVMNNDALRKLKPGDVDDVYVEISIHEEGEIRYIIRRSVHFTKKGESTEGRELVLVGGRLPSGIDVEEKIELSERPKNGTGDWVAYTDPQRVKDRIERIFPESLSSYFLFDAELLDNFFKKSDKENHVKKGIENISGLPLIESAIKHVKNASEIVRKSTKDVNLEPIENERNHYIKAEKRYNEQIESAKINIESLDKNIKSNEEYLRNYNADIITSVQGQIDTIEKAIKRLNKHAKDHKHDMNNWLLYANTVLRLREPMINSMELCNAWEREGKIPIAVSKHALENMLQGNPPECICGTPLNEGSDSRTKIKTLLDKNLAESPVIQSITVGRSRWSDMVAESTDMGIVLDKYRANRDEMDTEEQAYKKNKKTLAEKLEGYNEAVIREKSKEVRRLKDELVEQERKLAIAESEMAKASAGREICDRKYDRIVKEDKKYTSQKNRMAIAKAIQSILSQCKSELIDEMRQTVSEKTTEYFHKLVSKDDFSSIEISNAYRASALGHDERAKSLSEGQSCCLALSYIAAIREISNRNYFMVIDSPLHNISQLERVGIAKNLPSFLPDTQITLLVQDQEYTGIIKDGLTIQNIPSVRTTLLGTRSLWKEYVLKTEKNKGDVSEHSTISEVERNE